ncbi:hypothetical protein Droror1_Dr00026895, partial [Drosera rotundifolia]
MGRKRRRIGKKTSVQFDVDVEVENSVQLEVGSSSKGEAVGEKKTMRTESRNNKSKRRGEELENGIETAKKSENDKEDVSKAAYLDGCVFTLL